MMMRWMCGTRPLRCCEGLREIAFISPGYAGIAGDSEWFRTTSGDPPYGRAVQFPGSHPVLSPDGLQYLHVARRSNGTTKQSE
ncbi:MAG: hypothetical protein R3C01_15275 [Planctomycetaceae bacterium]